jgi:4-nitrophenyl phosphatase
MREHHHPMAASPRPLDISSRPVGAVPPVVLCDLDGVVWLAHREIPGASDAIATLRAAGVRVLFVTNNSAARVAEHEAALAAIGIPAEGDVLSSALAAATLVSPGERVHVLGGDGIVEAVEGRGAVVIDAADGGDPPDAVLVGLDRRLTYDRLTTAVRAVRTGARFVATNDDATYPTPTGPIPGGGAIVAAVTTASGVAPVIAGKPHAPMADLVRATVGDEAAERAVMVGDRDATDGAFARLLGCRFALVWSGVTSPDDPPAVAPDLAVPDLAAVVAALLDGS